MPRVRKGYKARRRRNRILKSAKGFRGKRNSCHSIAMEAVQHSWMHMYRHRKQRKREFRKLWIIRINAAARNLSQSYSKFMGSLKKNSIQLNRKMLSELAISDPAAFEAVLNAGATNEG